MGVRLVRHQSTVSGGIIWGGIINGGGSGGGNGTYDHDKLYNRDLPNQHPIQAIEGLEDALDDIDVYIRKVEKEFNTSINNINIKIDDIPNIINNYMTNNSTTYIGAISARSIYQENHGFEIGDVVYYRHNKGYKKALAIDSYDINVVGIVIRVSDEDHFTYQYMGFVSTDMYDTNHGYTQGLPIYLSDTNAGKVTQTQPFISKTIGYPVENNGLIIAIERGIQYSDLEYQIGDFITSPSTFNIRSDGFIRVIENVAYKSTVALKLIKTVSATFKDSYMSVNASDGSLTFINTQELYTKNNVQSGAYLFIKAF